MKSNELLERFADRLSPDEQETNRTLNAVGEQAVMIDNLCGALLKEKISVTLSERRALAELLNRFRPVEVADLAYIHDGENTLASLVVTDQP